MSTIRTVEEVVNEVKARLEAIRVADGAETDIGVAVYPGRAHVDDSMLPCATIIEMGDTPEHRGPGTTVSTTIEFAAFAYVKCVPANPATAAHKAIRDLKRALFRTDGKPSRDWGRKVRDLQFRGYELGARSDGAPFVAAAVKFAVEIAEDVANP